MYVSGEESGNGVKAVTLAILGERLEQLSQQLRDHDTRQREEFGSCRRNCAIDHDTLTRHDSELMVLQTDISKAKDVVDGLRNESRLFNSLAGIVAMGAAALGLTKS